VRTRLATHAAAAAAGALLALLLTQPAASRQASTPRPSMVTQDVSRLVAPSRTGAPIGTPQPSPAVVASPTPRPSAEPAPLGTPRAGGRPALPVPGRTPKPRRTTRPADGRRGVASFVRASLGARYLAARLPKGTRLRVCGPVGCITGTVNDYGPSKRVHPERIVDLSAADFTRVCGPLSVGVCRVTVR